MSQDYSSIIAKFSKYTKIRNNTSKYREEWSKNLKDTIVNTLTDIVEKVKIKATVEHKSEIENLEVVILNLGRTKSGIKEKLGVDDYKNWVRHNGLLIYQQLFNGKVMILISYPFVEGYGEPQPPKTLEILRPEELTVGFIQRHVEDFLKELTSWEDYDDDQPAPPPIGFTSGFQMGGELEDESIK